MGEIVSRRQRPRIFNTAFESGIRSLVILTSCYPTWLGLRQLVVLDHLVVHTADVSGPASLHPSEDFRTAEILVRRSLVASGLSLMGTRKLIDRHATENGFKYKAGEEAGSFVDLLRVDYLAKLKERAGWLSEHVIPLGEQQLDIIVAEKIGLWASEFQDGQGLAG